MPFIRTATTRRGRGIAVASLLATVLSLTACQGHSGGRNDPASPAASPSADSSTSAKDGAASGGGATSDSGSTTRPTPTAKPTAKPTELKASGAQVACIPEMLRFHAGAARRPINHMILTVTNISDRTCDFAAQPYPKLRFNGEQRHATPVIRRSKRKAALSLAPRATAYAGIITSAADLPDGKGEKISQFGVALARHTTPTQVGLDGGAPVYVDMDTAKVTYWQSCRADALKW
ncbi:DUF4232 domain-containing protein [Streptomyces sp. NPDC050636]|uniref:DUF4232 domain-containing protein n=1 Tax=Streptomyces sp. NPDC050636 TaxID=3154510 RepID=UPI003444C6A6